VIDECVNIFGKEDYNLSCNEISYIDKFIVNERLINVVVTLQPKK
jgi:hypothetical protein